MTFLARDIFEAGTPQLRNRSSARIPPQLANHLLDRLKQSFGGLGTVNRWLSSTQSLDHDTILRGAGLFHKTVQECQAIMADIDAGVLCPIGLVLAQSWAPWDVFHNHVVLVWGYELAGTALTLRIYDCNREGRDDITIQLDIGALKPAKPIATNGTDIDTKPGFVRGFFRLNYTRADPAPAYIDDAIVSVSIFPPSQMIPSSSANVRVNAINRGSTTWIRGNYKLGSFSPRDNMSWGINRIDLPLPKADPDQTISYDFQATAPANAGQYTFAWQMVREGVHWFGTNSTAVPIGVGIPSTLCDQLHQQHLALAGALTRAEQDLQNVDWSDPVVARIEAGRLARILRELQRQIIAHEAHQVDSGCAPG
jgi:hypothetical protein